MIDHPALMPYVEKYENLQGEPLRIILRILPGSQMALYDLLNLDNLLARCVVDEATQGQLLSNSQEPYRLPVPLRRLWTSTDGYPLWAVTPFWPEGLVTDDVIYFHKKQHSGRYTKTKSGEFAVRQGQGRYMERRIAQPCRVCSEWHAWCIGDGEEIARLLGDKAHVGKRRHAGLGAVQQFQVESANEFLQVRDGHLLRAVPAEALPVVLPNVRMAEAPAPIGWTPPQWKRELFRPGWWPGAQVEVDFFEAI